MRWLRHSSSRGACHASSSLLASTRLMASELCRLNQTFPNLLSCAPPLLLGEHDVSLRLERAIKFDYGVADRLSPLVRRVIANNPGPFTYTGTGTYIIGRGHVAVVDPGPADEAHINALVVAINGETVSHVLVTHTHMDHSPGCKLLKTYCDAPTYGFGPHGGDLAESSKVEEGADRDFVPDVRVAHGDVLTGDGWSVECVHTPGHTSNHMCFCLSDERALFTGDHVMGWSTSVISPPDGNMGDYMRSLALLLERDDAVYYPTHGPPVWRPRAHIEAFIEHRLARERQIRDCLQRGVTRIVDMVPIMYKGTDRALFPAAARSVLAAVELMHARGEIRANGAPSIESELELWYPSREQRR